MIVIDSSADRPRTRLRGSRRLASTALAGALVIGCLSPSAATGAWFTATRTVSANQLTAATLAQVDDLKAVTTTAGVDVSWTSALEQPWATANSVATQPAYTVTRTIDGANPTVVATGTDTTVTDPYPRAISVAPVVFDAASQASGYVKGNGTVVMWGYSDRMLLGNGQSNNRTPALVDIPSGNPIISMALSGETGTALSSNGSLWIWGLGAKGGSTCSTEASAPIQVSLPGGISPVSASPVGSCTLIVLDSGGNIWQRGGSIGGSSTSFIAVPLPGGRKAKQLTKAETVLATDGTVWSWGSGSSGEHGDGTTAAVTTPVQALIPDGAEIRYVSSDAQSRSTIAIAKGSRAVYAWGSNGDGQLGLGTVGGNVIFPTLMKTPSGHWWSDVQTAAGSTILLSGTDRSKMWSTGQGRNGRWGNGADNSTETGDFVSMSVPEGIVSTRLALGAKQAYIFDHNTNDVYGWGYASDGSSTSYFGDGALSPRVYLQPTLVQKKVYTNYTAARSSCGDGATPNSDSYCPRTGVARYSVSYTHQSWNSPAADVAAE